MDTHRMIMRNILTVIILVIYFMECELHRDGAGPQPGSGYGGGANAPVEERTAPTEKADVKLTTMQRLKSAVKGTILKKSHDDKQPTKKGSLSNNDNKNSTNNNTNRIESQNSANSKDSDGSGKSSAKKGKRLVQFFSEGIKTGASTAYKKVSSIGSGSHKMLTKGLQGASRMGSFRGSFRGRLDEGYMSGDSYQSNSTNQSNQTEKSSRSKKSSKSRKFKKSSSQSFIPPLVPPPPECLGLDISGYLTEGPPLPRAPVQPQPPDIMRTCSLPPNQPKTRPSSPINSPTRPPPSPINSPTRPPPPPIVPPPTLQTWAAPTHLWPKVDTSSSPPKQLPQNTPSRPGSPKNKSPSRLSPPRQKTPPRSPLKSPPKAASPKPGSPPRTVSSKLPSPLRSPPKAITPPRSPPKAITPPRSPPKTITPPRAVTPPGSPRLDLPPGSPIQSPTRPRRSPRGSPPKTRAPAASPKRDPTQAADPNLLMAAAHIAKASLPVTSGRHADTGKSKDPYQRLYEETQQELIDMYKRETPPDRDDFKQLLARAHAAKYEYESRKTQKDYTEEAIVFMEKYTLVSPPEDDDDKMAAWPHLLCIRKCYTTWGYLFVPTKDEYPTTSLDFFACGKLHPITYGEVSDSEAGKPKCQPDGSWKFECNCVTNEEFLKYLLDSGVNSVDFNWYKSNDPKRAMPWLQEQIKVNKLEVGLMTQTRFIDWLKRLLSKYDFKTKDELYRRYREDPEAYGVAGERVSDADSDYWRDNVTWLPDTSAYAEDYKKPEGEIR